MNFERKTLAELSRCYAVSDITLHNSSKLLFATEGHGACLMFDAATLAQSLVWDAPGGTMSIIPVPDTDGEFLAVQRFFPTFDSAQATIVWAKPLPDGGWRVDTLMDLPYVHRFDVLRAGGVSYFLGSVLCNSKQSRDDWSDPGKVYAGVLGKDAQTPVELQVLCEGLTKNHGYTRAVLNGKECGIVTADEGAFICTPPQAPGEQWTVEQIFSHPISDIAIVDIDGDGQNEIATIESFHGKNFFIYKMIDGSYKRVYRYPKKFDFGHVVWGGALRGTPCFLGGCRRECKELFMVTCTNPQNLVFHTQTIAHGNGPSNIHVLRGEAEDLLLAADREIGQAALYRVTD